MPLTKSASLYMYKSDFADSEKSVSWVVWLKILIEAAPYLDFLHSLEDHIICGKFRPLNILLDGGTLNFLNYIL